MLYDPTRHQTLRPIAWSEERAREAIDSVVSDTESRFTPDRYWPVHPRDVEGPEDSTQLSTTLYRQ